MADFSLVTARVATGAAVQSAGDAQDLVAAGITHILDLTDAEDDSQFLPGLGLAYLYNPTADDGGQRPDDWWAASLLFAFPAFAIEGACIYCHCSAGINRGPSTAYAVLRAVCGLAPVQADGMIRTVRPQVGLAYARQFDTYWAARNPGKAAGP